MQGALELSSSFNSGSQRRRRLFAVPLVSRYVAVKQTCTVSSLFKRFQEPVSVGDFSGHGGRQRFSCDFLKRPSGRQVDLRTRDINADRVLERRGKLFGPHATNRDLRRTFKTLAGKAGIPKEIRDRLQNHALQDVSSKHYDRWNYMVEKRAGMAKWDKFVRAMLAKKRVKAAA